MKTIADIRHENLLKLIDEYGSVTKFAAAAGKSYAQISQLKNRSLNSTGKGKPRSVGDDLAREFESAFDKPHGWMDADHTKHSDLPPPPSDKDYVLIPEYEIKAECGSGEFCEHVTIRGELAFKKSWLASRGLKKENLEVIFAKGDSMFPSLEDGEAVLIDKSQTTPREGKIFLILRYENGLVFKRIMRDKDGGWLYQSDNQNKAQFPDLYPLSGDKIIGMAVWRGGNL